MDELFAIIGGSWRQVLVYPGGLTLLVVVAVTHKLWASPAPPASSRRLQLLQILSVWLLCALLPWPKTYSAYPLDLLTALVLLEAPHWLRLRAQLRSRHRAARQAALAGIVNGLRVYPLLALGTALLAQSSVSLLLPAIKASRGWEHWSGVVVWAVALPPLLALGPWHAPADLAANVRRVGHVALLAVLALPGGDALAYGAGAIAAFASFASFTTLDRLWHAPAERWQRWQPLVALLSVGLLLWAAIQQFATRLQ